MAGEKYEEAGAREKLEAVLVELQADKITKTEYNEKDYINDKLKQNNMEFEGNIVIVEGWQFEINRSIPQIAQNLGKETELKKDTRGKAKFMYDSETKNVAKVDVTIEIDASIGRYTVQYNIVENSDNSEKWVDYTAGNTIEVTKNITIYGRIIDKITNEIGYKFFGKIITIDDKQPKQTIIEINNTKVKINETIQAKVTLIDLESGINTSKSKYIVNTNADKINEDSDIWDSAQSFTHNPQTLNIIQEKEGEYFIHILSTDLAGNKVSEVSPKVVFTGTTIYARSDEAGRIVDTTAGKWQLKTNANWTVSNERFKMEGNGHWLSMTSGSQVDLTYKEKMIWDIKYLSNVYPKVGEVEFSLKVYDGDGYEIARTVTMIGDSVKTVQLDLDVSDLKGLYWIEIKGTVLKTLNTSYGFWANKFQVWAE